MCSPFLSTCAISADEDLHCFWTRKSEAGKIQGSSNLIVFLGTWPMSHLQRTQPLETEPFLLHFCWVLLVVSDKEHKGNRFGQVRICSWDGSIQTEPKLKFPSVFSLLFQGLSNEKAVTTSGAPSLQRLLE